MSAEFDPTPTIDSGALPPTEAEDRGEGVGHALAVGEVRAPQSLRRRRGLELGVFVALLALALAVAAFLGSARDARRVETRAFDVIRAKVAEPAPEFELTDLSGRPVRLRDFRGRVVFLNFWATWCAPCRDEFPAMVAMARELGPRGLVILAVNHQEPRAQVEAFGREFGVSFPVLLDAAGEVARQYRLQALPTTYFVDRDGTLAGIALGYREWDAPEARAYVRELLDGVRTSAAR